MTESANPTDSLVFIKQSAVKEFLSAQGFRSSGDIFDSLNEQIKEILVKGAKRCKDNNRSTVKGADL